jgi:ATP-dependent protease ClpP protease subunit
MNNMEAISGRFSKQHEEQMLPRQELESKGIKMPSVTEIRKSPDFRPDPARGIFLTGVIDQDALERHSPRIMELLHSSSLPVTLYIESPGGSPHAAERLHQLLCLPPQDGGERHRVITVGLTTCASAACDLLMAGDYAAVHTQTLLLCHGVRRSGDGAAVTRETAADLAQSLSISNERFAMQTANNAIGRFIFRYVLARPLFPSIRENRQIPTLSDESCFLAELVTHVSSEVGNLLNDAMIMHLDTEITDLDVLRTLRELETPERTAEIESVLLKCIVDKLVSDHKDDANWTFREAGLSELQQQFEILLRSREPQHTEQIDRLVARWGEYLLDGDDTAALATVNHNHRIGWLREKVGDTIRALWFIFVSICRRLQQNENYLTAEEAFWIGLVDEVIGRTDLPSPRLLVEYAPSEG